MTVPADHPSVTDRAGWRALRAAVLARADHRCEVCQALVYVVLTIAHRCACSPACLDAEHVAALCQRDHLLLDAEQHRTNAARTRRRRGGQATLPGVEP